ncbi:expressed unknown protein [Seminavis robusta]|uniref:Uncharacterized protein n=1 Tax=Seminavis robusta TaxID=568900 RepID=A0A9N8H9W5_9STRA|nr:expressed unknown protein [Seminavis robusta]|eukprot:Sro205_g086340.1 n/a (152) ;mRNA; f:76752-77207
MSSTTDADAKPGTGDASSQQEGGSKVKQALEGAGEVAVLAAETVADALTDGLYSTVKYSDEAVDNNEATVKNIEESKADKKQKEDEEFDADVELAGEITANVLTGGLYGIVSSGIDMVFGDDDSDDEEKKAKKEMKKQMKKEKKEKKKQEK